MSRRISVEVKFESADGEHVAIKGTVGRWDGDIHTLPDMAALALKKTLADSVGTVEKYITEIADLKAKLASATAEAPAEVAPAVAKASRSQAAKGK